MDVSFKKKLKNTLLKDEALSGKIMVVSVLLAAPERQARSQTHFFMVKKKEDKIKTWIIVKCRLFWI